MTTESLEARADCSGGPDACWEWQGAPAGGGYFQVRHRGKLVSGRRLMYELVHGAKLKSGQCVCNNCGNRKCVNPKHLQTGTRAGALPGTIVQRRLQVALAAEQSAKMRTVRTVARTGAHRSGLAHVRSLAGAATPDNH